MNRLKIDHTALNNLCKKNHWTYRDLAAASGLSITQSYHLLSNKASRSVSGGATTIGCLMTLNVPGLFFLEKDSRLRTYLKIEPVDERNVANG